jgi:hypothetical protein
MQFPKRAYDVGTAAALKLIRHEMDDVIMPKVPSFFKSMVPLDKEPEAAAVITKIILDAVAADPGSAPVQQPARPTVASSVGQPPGAKS